MPISAHDEEGKPVDWWFMYKVPKLGKGANGDSATGYEYVYYDAVIDKTKDRKKRHVGASPFTIDSGRGALNETLQSIFDKPSSTTGWILYNDETPEAANMRDDGNLGHTKGVLAFDTASKTACWLLHSWPKFAELNPTKDPTPMYGQTYLCLSLSLETASKIATQMKKHQEPQTYECREGGIDKKNPLYALMQPFKPAPKGDSNVISLKTKKGMPFRVIAENRAWNKDFWN